MNTVLLTLGRLPKCLDVARAFAGAGWRVLVAEPYRRHLTGASRAVAASFVTPAPAEDHDAYLAAVREIAAREGALLVVPVSEETMHVAHLAGKLPAGCELFTMTPELVLRLHSKLAFPAFARSLGLAAPETEAVGTEAAARLLAAGRTVLKPVHSCSGQGVRFLPQGASAPEEGRAAVIQAFVEGRVVSSCTIARDGVVRATVIYEGAIMSGTVAVGFRRLTAEHAAEAWIARFVAATGYSGFVSFDFVVDAAGQPWAIECNPRATSGVHFLTPESVFDAIVGDGAVGARFRERLELQQFYAALTETQGSVLRPRRFVANLRQLVRTADVTWRRDDPWPFLSMTATSWPILRESMLTGRSFGEVATRDIGWYSV